MKPFIITICCGLLSLLACKTGSEKNAIIAGRSLQVDSQPGACPYLTKDNHGNTVLSWARSINDSVSVLCFSVFSNGKPGSTITVPSSNNLQVHSENLPKIIFKPSGEIIALWGAANPNPRNKYAGLVFYARSADGGKSWTAPTSLVSDTAGYDQRYYDVALLPDGEVAAIWLDNRKTGNGEGSALFFAKTAGSSGFGPGRLISQPCCPCCRTNLYVDSKGGIHALYRGIIDDSIRDMVHILSADNGAHFTAPRRISNDNWVIRGCPHTGPAMTENREGLHYAWFTGGPHRGCYYTRSDAHANSYDQPQNISGAGAHPQITALANGELVCVWDEPVEGNGGAFKKIGLQKRAPNGAVKATGTITSDSATAAYPVVSPLQDNEAMVAYTLKKGEKNYVFCQEIR